MSESAQSGQLTAAQGQPMAASQEPGVIYEVNGTMMKELENRFCYHKPKGDQNERYVSIRAKILELAIFISQNTPRSREQSRALTALDDAMFNSNAAIARNE